MKSSSFSKEEKNNNLNTEKAKKERLLSSSKLSLIKRFVFLQPRTKLLDNLSLNFLMKGSDSNNRNKG